MWSNVTILASQLKRSSPEIQLDTSYAWFLLLINCPRIFVLRNYILAFQFSKNAWTLCHILKWSSNWFKSKLLLNKTEYCTFQCIQSYNRKAIANLIASSKKIEFAKTRIKHEKNLMIKIKLIHLKCLESNAWTGYYKSYIISTEKDLKWILW